MRDRLISAIKTLFSRWIHDWSNSDSPVQWKLVAFIILGSGLLTPLVYQLPLLGYDWFRLFYAGFLDQYPPWMDLLFAPFRLLPPRWSLALANSLSLVSVATITFRQSRWGLVDGLFAALLALLSPLVWYLLWDGQIDGLVLLGLFFLPWSIPLVLLRPQIIGWVLLSRKKWAIWMAVWLVASLLIWGEWISKSYSLSSGSIQHPTAMGWSTSGWPILLVGLWMILNSKGDPWRILAGAFLASPYVQPYHMTMLLPAIGRVRGWRRILLWVGAWVVGTVPGFTGITKYLALSFPIMIWVFLGEDTRDTF
jgi:hypothetical protein